MTPRSVVPLEDAGEVQHKHHDRQAAEDGDEMDIPHARMMPGSGLLATCTPAPSAGSACTEQPSRWLREFQSFMSIRTCLVVSDDKVTEETHEPVIPAEPRVSYGRRPW